MLKKGDIITFQYRLAPDDPFDGSYRKGAAAEPLTVRRGEVVRLIVEGTPRKGYHTYPITKRTSVQELAGLSKLKVEKVKGVTPLWPIEESEPEQVDEGPALGVFLEHEKPFSWVQDLWIAEDAPTGPLELQVNIAAQVCDNKGCTWVYPKQPLAVQVSDEPAIPMQDSLRERLEASQRVPEPVVVAVAEVKAEAPATSREAALRPTGDSVFGLISDTPEQYREKMESIAKLIQRPDGMGAAASGSSDLWGFILAGIFWGAVSLITPCVFPMIPITVSFFLKQSEKEHHRPIVMASVYSLTIVVVLTLAAAFLLHVFRLLSVHPVTNYLLGGLFVFFALSLFGMYEIELPSGLARFTSSREGKGGLVGTMFMALTFTIISFACVAPFLGGFGGTAASARPFWHNILGGLAFSATFAAPFFFLALFPTLLRTLPKSGAWLNSVKVIMGFLELAAAFKFFRAAELVQTAGAPSLFTYDLVLGSWIAMCLLSGLYLIGLFRLPHDSPQENIGVPRLLFSVAFLCLAFYLLPALFKDQSGRTQRPGGAVYAWVDSFLLPEATDEAGAGMRLTANLPYAVEESKKASALTGQPKRIFLDFTGITCTNCKINERTVFTRPDIERLFERYLVVQLYTDTVEKKFYAPEIRAQIERNNERAVVDAKDVNLPFQKRIFDDERLPLYAVLEPQLDHRIAIIGVYDEGRINNEAAFADFLREPEKWAGKQAGK